MKKTELKQLIIEQLQSIINENQDNLDAWKKLMDKYDLQYFTAYQTTSKSSLKQMREDWKSMRRYALNKLNKELNNSGKPGQLLNIDVSDDELYPYLEAKDKQLFFKYSRILDFSDGYVPKNLKIITKGMDIHNSTDKLKENIKKQIKSILKEDSYRDDTYKLGGFLKQKFPTVKFAWDEDSKGWWTTDEKFLNKYSSLRTLYDINAEANLKRSFNSKNPGQKMIVNSDFDKLQITLD